MLKLCRTLMAAVVMTAVLVISGCGGSSSTSSSSTARIRAVNMCPNGGSATFYVNAGSANGSQNFEQASSYLYIDGGDSVFSFLLSSYDTLAPPETTEILASGSAYSIVLFGRADVPTTDLRYTKLELLTDDTITPPAGKAEVRFVHAAPDAPTAGATIGGVSLATQLAYSSFTGYVAVPAGADQLVVTPSGSTAITLSQPFTAGHSYTVFLGEQTVPSLAGAIPVTTVSFNTLVLDDDL
jgi:hypothetical protein